MINFYTIHCPSCNVLKKKLDAKHIDYEEITDRDIMSQRGYVQLPILEINGMPYTYTEAIKWINSQEN